MSIRVATWLSTEIYHSTVIQEGYCFWEDRRSSPKEPLDALRTSRSETECNTLTTLGNLAQQHPEQSAETDPPQWELPWQQRRQKIQVFWWPGCATEAQLDILGSRGRRGTRWSSLGQCTWRQRNSADPLGMQDFISNACSSCILLRQRYRMQRGEPKCPN